MEQITSRKNPLITHIRKLISDRSYRRECGEYPGDGVKLLAEAAKWNAPLTCVVHTAGTELPALPDLGSDEGIIELQNKIDALQSGELDGQMSFDQQ